VWCKQAEPEEQQEQQQHQQQQQEQEEEDEEPQPVTLADVDNMTVIELKAALKQHNEVGTSSCY
jgi:hypothetical protein